MVPRMSLKKSKTPSCSSRLVVRGVLAMMAKHTRSFAIAAKSAPTRKGVKAATVFAAIGNRRRWHVASGRRRAAKLNWTAIMTAIANLYAKERNI